MDVPSSPNEKLEQQLLKNIQDKQEKIWRVLKYKMPIFANVFDDNRELRVRLSKYISLCNAGNVPRGRQKYRKRKAVEDVFKKLNVNLSAKGAKQKEREMGGKKLPKRQRSRDCK